MSGSLIHLPQLAVQPEQAPDPLTQYGKLQSIQALSAQRQQQQALMPGQLQMQQQQLEAGLLANKEKQQQVAQTDAMNKAFQGALTPDPTTGQPIFDRGKVLTSVAANPNGGSLVPGLTKTFNEIDKSAAEVADARDKHAAAQQDYFGSLASEIKAANYAPGAVGVALAHAAANGYGPQAQQMQQQFAQNPDAVKGWVDQAIAGSPKQQEAIKNAAQAHASDVETQIKQSQLDAAAKGGLAPGVPLENQEATAWLAKNPGKNLADYQKYAKTLVPAFSFNLQQGAGGGLQQTAIDQAAERYAATGQLPPAARGAAGLAQNRQIMNRAAELHPQGNLAENSAEYAANKASLTNIQKNFDTVSAFENTAGKNLDLFLKTAKPIVDSGSPWINKPLRAVAVGALGSDDMAAFNAARQTAVTEIGKVLNSSNASGVLSDSARHEVDGLIGPDATMKQIYSAANILKQDMANRHQSYQEQIADIKSRGVKAGGQQNPQQNSLTAPNSAPGAFDWNKMPQH